MKRAQVSDDLLAPRRVAFKVGHRVAGCDCLSVGEPRIEQLVVPHFAGRSRFHAGRILQARLPCERPADDAEQVRPLPVRLAFAERMTYGAVVWGPLVANLYAV